jgi:hypothetical protein
MKKMIVTMYTSRREKGLTPKREPQRRSGVRETRHRTIAIAVGMRLA